MDSLYNEDEAEFSLFPVKEIVHSFSPILGLTLVAFVLMRLGMINRMTTSLGVGVDLATIALFRA